MILALRTKNRQAFELVTNAIGAIDDYKRFRDRHALEIALDDLEKARRQDERYLLPFYLIAVIEDLLGRSRDAVEHLTTILSQAESKHPELVNEVRFNLAVAQYHGYSHEDLNKAAETLHQLLNDTGSLLNRVKYYRVRLFSLALLAQVHAMWSIPRSPEDVSDNEKEINRILSRYTDAVSKARRILRYSPMLVLILLTDRARFKEIKAIAHNALGMAEMYRSDYLFKENKKLRKLQIGLKHLEKSDKLFRRDWANYCDMGSCHMRIAYWGNVAAEFEKARDFLHVVVNELQPEYGFALYEIGRSYRIEGRFADALRYFNRAKKVPERERDVSDRRVQREIELAEKKSKTYP